MHGPDWTNHFVRLTTLHHWHPAVAFAATLLHLILYVSPCKTLCLRCIWLPAGCSDRVSGY